MRPIPHISAYRPESKLLETDGARRTIFKMGLVHAWDNDPGVSGTEPERTARFRDLLYAQTGLIIRPNRNRVSALTGIRPGAYGTPDRRTWE